MAILVCCICGFTWRKVAIKHVNFHLKTKTVFPKILKEATNQCFFHFIFRFWFLVTFENAVMKILRNLCLHFARQDGQDGKNRMKITQLKWPKYVPKTKRQKYGTNKTKITFQKNFYWKIVFMSSGSKKKNI